MVRNIIIAVKSKMAAIVAAIGLVIIGLAVFADRIGLDHNTVWGAGRIFLLAIGILIVFCAAFFYFVPSKLLRIYFLTVLIETFVVAVYVWFVSAGYWAKWPTSTNYYDLQATSFQHGQLSLQIKSDPALLALPDPYNVQARKAQPEISYIFDGSLYNGKFYLYWGPVPALILTAVKFIYPGEIGDQYLVFAFVSGLSIIQSLLILRIWRRFFGDLPIWTVLLGILLSGLIIPMTWMLNQPQVYEASIASGQFFLIGGLYFAFATLDRPLPSLWQLALTGVLWVLAVGSRMVLALPVIFMACTIPFWVARKNLQLHNLLQNIFVMSALILPLLLGAISLGWYNWARFGSVFETGLRYQLSGIDYRNYYKDIFLTSYIPVNLKNYLFTPFLSIPTFPFIKPISPDRFTLQDNSLPEFYFSREKITGLVYAAPFLLFALVGIAIFLWVLYQRRIKQVESGDGEDRVFLWEIAFSLTGMALLSFMIVMLYYYCTMRFAADFVPAVSLLALIGFWQGYDGLKGRSVLQVFHSAIAIGLAIWTVGISNLLAISGYTQRFSDLNPGLLKIIVKFFER